MIINTIYSASQTLEPIGLKSDLWLSFVFGIGNELPRDKPRGIKGTVNGIKCFESRFGVWTHGAINATI